MINLLQKKTLTKAVSVFAFQAKLVTGSVQRGSID